MTEHLSDAQLRGELCVLFNTLKNRRRLSILKLYLKKGSLSLRETQHQLSRIGLRHSSETIKTVYLAPLIDAGLIKPRGQGGFELTSIGRRVAEEAIKEWWLFEKLPPRSECYEELLLISLLHEPRSISSIDFIHPKAVIYRVVKRLQGLVRVTGRRSIYIALEGDEAKLSPTEYKVLRAVKEEGGAISLKELMSRRPISRRRMFKYLARLRAKGFLDRVPQETQVELTEEGRKAAATLWKMASYLLFNTEKTRLKALIISYLDDLEAPIHDEDLIEKVLNPYFREHYGRSIQPYEYDELKDELKREGIVEGNPFTGYILKPYLKSKKPKTGKGGSDLVELALL